MEEILSHFQVLRLNLRFRLNKAGLLPAYKGSMLHGLMGQGLAHIDSRLYSALYTQHDHQQPKAYSIVCSDAKDHTPEGYILNFELRLFGDAIQCSHTLIESLQYAAQHYGIGPQRIKAKLICLSSITNGKEVSGIQPIALSRMLTNTQLQPHECALALKSPLRLKHHARLFALPRLLICWSAASLAV
ncbi:hypothetical protein [Vibrio mexicanus]|uniref:hypothetical protein n=1 Tax=Vibrio mexicanus TaxID=1004326 RepID=UPI00063C7FDF|nr:hypothetical protein [Vibrio mexicanus]